MLGFIIYLIVVGIIAGYLARALVPGRDPMGFAGTALLGIVGSFVGGFLGHLVFHHEVHRHELKPAGLLGSIIGAVVALLLYRLATRSGSVRSRL